MSKTRRINLIKNATAQSSSLRKYRKIQLSLVPTRTMEQNKIFSKTFKQRFHINDIQHNIVVVPFITKPILTINILNCKLRKKDKYTRLKNTALTVFQKLNKQRPFFTNFYSVCNQGRK